MTTAVRTAVLNIITTVESGTAPTMHGGVTRYKHVPGPYSPEDLRSLDGPTRRFVLESGDGIERDGRMSQPGNPQGSTDTWYLTVAYELSDNAFEMQLVLAEDKQYLSDLLEHPTPRGDSSNDRQCGPPEEDVPEGASSGAVALVTIPITFKYRPTFSL